MRAITRAVVLACAFGCVATPAAAQATTGWHQLEVPGGRETLRKLGVDDGRERAAVMVELIRRFIFATSSQSTLESSLRQLPAGNGDSLTLPLPLAPAKWSALVFARKVPSSRLFAEILLDPSARLLFHGLAGLDRETRGWIEGQDELLRRLYRNPSALKSFALFAPAVQVSRGRIELPGRSLAEQRWSAILNSRPEEAARFTGRLFEDRDGRTAGLFATIAFADEARRGFLLGTSAPRFAQLVSGFAQCYPAHSNDYPIALRSYDPALLLLELGLTHQGQVNGPASQRFWDTVFAASDLSRAPGVADLNAGGAIDAAWLVDRLCDASAPDRAAVFATMLAGTRVFTALQPSEWPEAVLALRVRRLFPSIFMSMERAGVRNPATFAMVGRHALKLDRLVDLEGATIALRQFQGALALILNALGARTVGFADADRLLASLSSVPFSRERYDGGIAGWITREWLPTVGRALKLPADLTAEQVTAAALAGPPVSPTRVHWEGVDYVLDFPAATRQRLREVRARQAGLTLDAALAAGTDAPLAQALASWAYAPHVGEADSGALVGGDGSARHDLGLRSVNRTRFEQRWEVAARAGERGAIAGSYLGLAAPLASWSLRRIASDRIPPPPTIGDNDRSSLVLTVALSDPNQLTDAGMSRIATSIAEGSQLITKAGSDPDGVMAAARSAAMSPWRRAVLLWVIAEEPERLPEQFTLTHRARLGGLRAENADPWGTAWLARGCLCLRMPPPRVPELVLGRPADGIVGGQSADLMLRIATLLSELRVPAALAAPVLSYAMRDFLDAVRPSHPADFDAFSRQAPFLDRTTLEDYIGAIAAVGALRPVGPQ